MRGHTTPCGEALGKHAVVRRVWCVRVQSRARWAPSRRTAGIQTSIDGDDLVLEPAPEQPVAVVDLLTEHKAGILTMLRADISSPHHLPTDPVPSAAAASTSG